MNQVILSIALISGIFGRQYQVAIPPACPGGVCPAIAAPAPGVAPVPPSVVPPAKVPAMLAIPVTVEVKAAAPKPFPGPSLNPPRVLWVWDNGVVFDSSAGVWRWQNEDGTWNQK